MADYAETSLSCPKCESDDTRVKKPNDVFICGNCGFSKLEADVRAAND